ncbi:MAG: SET domain-containing protein-lysine N-methyltransferase [Acidobacteria bacterium]|nr:SET domain-containing protein-lysine N-methyltransferase [Acidobacteriota bacterium]
MSEPTATDLRFYAGLCEAYPYEPTRDRFQVVQTQGQGEGLISLVPFQPGEIVFVFHGEILPYQLLSTLQVQPGTYVSDPYVMGKVLHACDPNMSCEIEKRLFRALKPIQPGDFLTMDYETTEDELYQPFYCSCSASDCRGWVRGRMMREASEH